MITDKELRAAAEVAAQDPLYQPAVVSVDAVGPCGHECPACGCPCPDCAEVAAEVARLRAFRASICRALGVAATWQDDASLAEEVALNRRRTQTEGAFQPLQNLQQLGRGPEEV